MILLNETLREETKNTLEKGEKMKTCFQKISTLQKDREKLSSEPTNKMETRYSFTRKPHVCVCYVGSLVRYAFFRKPFMYCLYLYASGIVNVCEVFISGINAL